MTDIYLPIPRMAQIYRVSRQAIYLLIRTNKIKAFKEEGKWMIFNKEMEKYQVNKYSHQNRVIDGVKVFDNEKGLYSARQAALILNMPIQRLYYLIRIKALPAVKNGSAYVLKYKDFIKLKDKKCTNQNK